LAVSQWSAACTARDAEACSELANLHERGIGVPPSAEQAKALRERARDLCKQKPSAFCDTLQKEPP
jgi:TPR repeat protein